MQSARHSGSTMATPAQKPRGKTTAGARWKAWVLLTSLGATVLGWIGFIGTEPPPPAAVVAPQRPAPQRPTPRRAAAVPLANVRREPPPLAASTVTLPAMPDKPIFEAPVTRTRRS